MPEGAKYLNSVFIPTVNPSQMSGVTVHYFMVEMVDFEKVKPDAEDVFDIVEKAEKKHDEELEYGDFTIKDST